MSNETGFTNVQKTPCNQEQSQSIGAKFVQRQLPKKARIVKGPCHAEFNAAMNFALGAATHEMLDCGPVMPVFIVEIPYKPTYGESLHAEHRSHELTIGLHVYGYELKQGSLIHFHGVTSENTVFVDWQSRAYCAEFDFRTLKGQIEFGAPASIRH